MRLPSILAAMILFGCGGSSDGDGDGADASRPDAPAAADAGLDAPAASCTAPGECPCFSNYDCADTHACTSLDDTGENVWCLEGERGSGEAGVPCEDETDCASALCVEDSEGGFRCSDICEEDNNQCPEELPRCLFIGFGVDVFICAREAEARRPTPAP
jgi:hypothetical protein